MIGKSREFFCLMNRVRKQLHINDLHINGIPCTVAVLDSGIDSTHLDFDGRIVDFCDFVQNQNDFGYDDYGHGTHVCGCIAGDGTASNGYYKGIAPHANLLVAKVLDKKGNGKVEHMIEGIQWILSLQNIYHVRVLNISIGTDVGFQEQDYQEIMALLNEAWRKGIVVICAAGNGGPENESISMLGRNRNIIAVGCHEGEMEHDFPNTCQLKSGRGRENDICRKPDLVAPGTEIISCRSSMEILNKRDNGYYCKKSGTSMATAIVSGLAALFFENSPNESNEYCKRRMLLTAKDLGEPWNKQGYGMIQPENFMLT